MTKPRYSIPALQDVVEIGEYIARHNSQAAGKIIERLETECQRISENPERGLKHEELPDYFLVVPVGNYLIIYQNEHDGVYILRIVHGARNLRQIFPE